MSSTHPFLDQGLSILNVRLSNPPKPGAPGVSTAPAKPFITLSRECCAGASTLGQELIPLLDAEFGESGQNWLFLDRDLIARALNSHQLPERLAQYLPEDRISEIKALVGELVGLHPSLWQLEQKISEAIMQLADLGRVIFAGRAAYLVTRGMPGGLHVRLVAPLEVRIRRMMAMEHCSADTAAQKLASVDAARRRYVRTNFDREIDDPHLYDLVINTERITPEAAAQLVLTTLRTRAHHPAAAIREAVMT